MVVRYRLDSLALEGAEVGPVRGDFRLRDKRIAFLVDLGPLGTVRVEASTEGDVTLHGRNGQRLECGAAGMACAVSE